MHMQFKRDKRVFDQKMVPLEKGDSFPVLTFADWDRLPGIRHCFTTRAGGVSEGYLASLNFRAGLYDPTENIRENFRRAAVFFGQGPDRIVCAQQTHTANVRIVTEADAGKGVVRERDYRDVDGLITDVPGLILFTSHADCAPLYLYDPVRRVIALAHSGWKGTAARIGEVTIRKMQETYGCRPQDIYAAVGPSICVDCYEISEDVAQKIRKAFGALTGHEDWQGKGPKSGQESKMTTGRETGCENGQNLRQESGGEIPRILYRGKRPGKYQLDLWQANARILEEAGIRPDHLTVTNLCTCCNPSALFSHRATGGKRGNQGAFLMLEPRQLPFRHD